MKIDSRIAIDWLQLQTLKKKFNFFSILYKDIQVFKLFLRSIEKLIQRKKVILINNFKSRINFKNFCNRPYFSDNTTVILSQKNYQPWLKFSFKRFETKKY